MNKDKMKLEEALDYIEYLIHDLKASSYNQNFIKALETLLEENKNSIPIKKIEDKIEELEQQREKATEENQMGTGILLTGGINYLQELLDDKQTINNQEEFIRNKCSKCKNRNKEECNIVQKINGEYDCINKK